jgi:hypothetical protein
MKFKYITIAVIYTLIFTQCKQNVPELETKAPVVTQAPAVGMQVPDSIANNPDRKVATKMSYCYKGAGSNLTVDQTGDLIQGTVKYTENGKKMLEGKILGQMVKDTFQAIVLSTNYGAKPQHLWFLKSGDNYTALVGAVAKNDKGLLEYTNRKGLTLGTVFTKTDCSTAK